MTEERFTELEIKLSYQDDLLQTLNSIVSEQQKQIYKLEKTCTLLAGRIKNTVNSEGISQQIERPPHY